MASVLRSGHLTWGLTRDSEGHREYGIRFQVVASKTDGPATILSTPGLPTIGSQWAFDGDLDPWALCHPDVKVAPILTKEPNTEWTLDYKFSTKPLKRCQDTQIDNPLDEPPRVSGSFLRVAKPLMQDRLGNPILNVNGEPIEGLTKDEVHPTVVIEQNLPGIDLNLNLEFVDTLNNAALWGVGVEQIKLSSFSWERKLYGVCTYYYSRKLEFEISFGGHHLEDILENGFKVRPGAWNAAGHWIPDLARAGAAFASEMFFDRRGTITKTALKANGDPLIFNPADPANPLTPVFHAAVKIFRAKNFLLLGIPTSF